MPGQKPTHTLYTLLNVGPEHVFYRGYVKVISSSGKVYPSYVQFSPVDVTTEVTAENDGVPIAETTNSFYRLEHVDTYPEWATGDYRYFPRPENLEVTLALEDAYGRTFLKFADNGKQVSHEVVKETDEWWQTYGSVRYLK